MNKLFVFLFILLTFGLGELMSAQTKYCRYEYNNSINYGIIKGKIIFKLNQAPWNEGVKTGELVELKKVKLLYPSEPQIIIGLAKSYKESWKDKTPPKTVRWFIKPHSSAASPEDNIILPPSLGAVKVEVELVIVIGKKVKNANLKEAGEAIFGYTLGNDIVGSVDSYHKIQGEPADMPEKVLATGLKDGDGFEPFGPVIVTNFDWKNSIRKMNISNSETGKNINYKNPTSGLLYSPEKIVSDLSKVFTLFPGDIISTGTTKSFLSQPGDVVTISIDGIGKFFNKVIKKQ